MKKSLIILVLTIGILVFGQEKTVLVIHGGAGYMTEENLSAEKQQAYKDKMEEALLAGYNKIREGKSSVVAVQAAIVVLEDSPLFNAGKGAVFTNEETNELDASIMDGKTENAGAVAGVKTIKNPIIAAFEVMENSPHVFLSREGAESFAKERGLEIVDTKYFYTEDNFKQLKKIKENAKPKTQLEKTNAEKFGTVGAVAIDQKGNIAAGTSTGGMTNKKWARIGDSPVIGAGTYANSQVGISSTGWGEFYIRSVAAFDLAARMKYANEKVVEAAKNVIQHIENLGGNGGIIALDKDGNVATEFNTPGMFRGTISDTGEIQIEIFKQIG